MGRPFDDEVGRLESTFDFARRAEIGRFTNAIGKALNGPLIAVGSGGSFTAAAFLRKLHQEATGIPCLAVTPLELESMRFVQPDTSIWMLSARGKNVDVLAAARLANVLEPAAAIAVIATTGTPLNRIVAAMPLGESLEFDSPAGKDGFLATNSLLATIVLLYRAYRLALGEDDFLPTFSELIGGHVRDIVKKYDTAFSALWQRKVLLILHDAGASIGTIDLESKFSEAALSFTKVSDFRTFAHGRHHWLSRFGSDTGILAVSSRNSRRLADRSIALLPPSVTTRSLELRHDATLGEIEFLVHAFLLTASLGHAKLVDPGRPGVAEFGSKLYNLSRRASSSREPTSAVAAQRKLAAAAVGSLEELRERASAAVVRLQSETFAGAVFDLDGTLVAPHDRWLLDARHDVREALKRLLTFGVAIGVATGRGPSRKTTALLRSFFDKRYWPKILVGYHNGAIVESLDCFPATESDTGGLGHIRLFIEKRLGSLQSVLEVESSPTQLTLRSRSSNVVVRAEQLWIIATEAIAESEVNARAVRSSHSIDIIGEKSSKLNVVRMLESQRDSKVLRFGDMGAWPGNDYELLASPYGLSVDRVSPDPLGCWNILPRGQRSIDGLLYYLARLERVGPGSVRMGNLMHDG